MVTPQELADRLNRLTKEIGVINIDWQPDIDKENEEAGRAEAFIPGTWIDISFFHGDHVVNQYWWKILQSGANNSILESMVTTFSLRDMTEDEAITVLLKELFNNLMEMNNDTLLHWGPNINVKEVTQDERD